MASEKIKCVTVSLDGMRGYTVSLSEFGALEFEIAEGAVGDKYQLEIVELTQEQLDQLPEFQGW